MNSNNIISRVLLDFKEKQQMVPGMGDKPPSNINSNWSHCLCGESAFYYKKCFEFDEREDSRGFITALIQIHLNNVSIESEANDLGNIMVKVVGDMEHVSQAKKVLQMVDELYEESR